MSETVILPWDEKPTTIADDVKARAVKLATLRAEVAARKERIAKARQGFEQTIETDLKNLAALEREVEAEESAVRGFALVAYEQTGAKKVCAGVEIKTSKVYHYDPVKAFEWAKQTKQCIVPECLDVKAFEKAAKVLTLDFVTVTEEPKATIATDLLAALSKEGA